MLDLHKSHTHRTHNCTITMHLSSSRAAQACSTRRGASCKHNRTTLTARPHQQHGRPASNSSSSSSSRPQPASRDVRRAAGGVPEAGVTVNEEVVADLIAATPLDDQQKAALEGLTNSLGVPLGTAKAMVFRKKALLNLAPGEILDRVAQVADIVGVTTDQAIEMVTIQPGLLFDTQKNADSLALGIRAICYELKADKEEVVDLILKNQSVLHGRQMHLSVADIAHLAMLREPTGRVAE